MSAQVAQSAPPVVGPGEVAPGGEQRLRIEQLETRREIGSPEMLSRLARALSIPTDALNENDEE